MPSILWKVVKYMDMKSESEQVPVPEVSDEATMNPTKPFDFSVAAIVVMKRVPETGREMWRALLRGEAGEENKGNAVIQLKRLFWDMVDGATLGRRSTGLMVEELIKEYDPDYKKHMGLEDRDGLELEFVLGPDSSDTCDFCSRPSTWVRHTQFAGDHFFCDVHAMASPNFRMRDASYSEWEHLSKKAS